MAESSEGWKDVERRLTSNQKDTEEVSPDVDFKVLHHQAFKALEDAHRWEERGIYAERARNELCNQLPGSEDGDYVALVESGQSTEILLSAFESVDGEIYARRNPEIGEDCAVYDALLDQAEDRELVEKYLERSVPMEETVGKELSFPSLTTTVRVYAPDQNNDY